MSFAKLPALALDIHSLDSLAMLLRWLRDHAERGVDVQVDLEECRHLRGALEWMAARGLVQLSNACTLVKTVRNPEGRILHLPSVPSFDVALTERGVALLNLLPLIRP